MGETQMVRMMSVVRGTRKATTNGHRTLVKGTKGSLWLGHRRQSFTTSSPLSNKQLESAPFCPLRTNFSSATGNICISCIEKEKLRATDVCCDIYLHGGRGKTHQ